MFHVKRLNALALYVCLAPGLAAHAFDAKDLLLFDSAENIEQTLAGEDPQLQIDFLRYFNCTFSYVDAANSSCKALRGQGDYSTLRRRAIYSLAITARLVANMPTECQSDAHVHSRAIFTRCFRVLNE